MIEDTIFGWIMAFAVLYLFYIAIKRHKDREAKHEKRVLLSAVKRGSSASIATLPADADVLPCPDHPSEVVVMTENDGVVSPCPKCR